MPSLVSCKPLKSEFNDVNEITITSEDFTLGRSLNNMAVIPFLSISRNHCKFVKNDMYWIIEDYSTFGIGINGTKLGRGHRKILQHQDIIALDPNQEFVYRFIYEDCELLPTSKKRIKIDPDATMNDDKMINDVKIKFEASQNDALKHIEDKIYNTKQIKTTNIMLKEQLQTDMKRKIKDLESEFALQIKNLKGEKDEVEKQKALLIEERDAQSAVLKQEMEGRISELMEQIRKHNEIETELIEENNSLKEKLQKEREEFLSELNRETSLKQDMFDKLAEKMREQEEIRMKEKQEFEELLKHKTELLRQEKDKELNKLAEQKKQRESELMNELNNIKKSLEDQVERTEKQKCDAQKKLYDQVEEMKKVKNEDQCKMEQLMLEREEIQKRLMEAQKDSQKHIDELKSRVREREVELAALAAERIQKQAEQSGEVISSLQEQLEKVRSQLQNVECENMKLIQNSEVDGNGGPSNNTLKEFGEILENELQCSICSELFVSAITLNCSHTFCKYCITMWKKKKKDCPICRTSITSECKSLVLDSFIEKMVQNLTPEMKAKRKEILRSRQELESEMVNQQSESTRRRRSSYDDYESDSDFLEEEGEDEEEEHDLEYHDFFDTYGSDGSDNGSYDEDSRSESSFVFRAASESSDSFGRRGGRGFIEGVPGSYYGGYGRCFRCGSRGHWAPGCPFA